MRISDWSSDVCSSDLDTSEVRLIPADAPETPPILISARQVKRQYSVDMAHGTLWVLTNDDHVNFRLARATLVDPEKWETVIPGSDSVRSDERRVGKECVIQCRSRGSTYH